MVYVGLTLLLEAPWIYAYIYQTPPSDKTYWGILFIISIPAWMILQLLMMILPLKLGLRHWKQMEF